MKFNPVISIIISFFFTGVSPKRLNVKSFIPHLNHQEFVVYNQDGSNSPKQNIQIGSGVEGAKEFLTRQYGLINNKDFIIKSSYNSDNGVSHIYAKQLIDNMEVANGDFNINIDKNGQVLSYGNSFHKKSPMAKSLQFNFDNPTPALFSLFNFIKFNPGVDEGKVVIQKGRNVEDQILLTNIPGIPKGIRTSPNYIQIETGVIEPVWSFQLDLIDNWFNAYVSPSGKVHAINDWVHQGRYNVIPISTNDPEDGPRQIITQQGSSTSSPKGWHNPGDGKANTKTSGNNVLAVDNRASANDASDQPQIEGGNYLNFDFPIDYSKEPETYTNASVTNLFYVSNMLHDIYYAHGFNEVAGNFQQNNFDKGGKGGDRVLAQAQDGSDNNNADFATPPDGEQPRMRVFLWDTSSPERDGDLDNGIIIHEYTHGLSNRLTGGPANSDCLSSLEAGGMGEGWSDMMAAIMRTRKEHTRNTDFGMGNYVNNGKTIRQYPYSTNKYTNPEIFSTINNYDEEHQWGAVWAEILYEVYWNLIDATGFSPDLLSGKYDNGNTLFIRLLIDGMKLQPCNPSFIQARDAIIQAEKQLTKEKFKCAIWKGFAKRGMGTNANEVDLAVDGYKVPKGC